jgi:hypothetical protein
MKKYIFLLLLLLSALKLSGQVQGLNYQAVIIDKNPQEIPGRDISGNIVPDQPVMVRFSILDAAGTIEYQEEHATTTDQYGMISIVIGQGNPTVSSPGIFSDIDWNGTPKSLKVDLSMSDVDVFYSDFSFEALTFVPYAYHRNITATGSLIVDGMSNLKSRLDVSEGSPAFFSGDLTVEQNTTLNNDLTVNAPSSLKGQVTINPDFPAPGDKTNYDSYPLRVEGGNHGIAVKIDGTRSSNNYFVTFWDDENIQGRIEGQTIDELDADPEYKFDNIKMGNEVLRAGVDVGIATAGVVSASSSSTVCAGLGACVTAPVPSLIVAAAAQLVLETANLAMVISEQVLYNESKRNNIGVTYQSGAGDYAEWLPKSDPDEKFVPGDIVGVKGGYISKSTAEADHFMVISHDPIVLGNMPEQAKESKYEKVAFMGQVLVRVSGNVRPGDFILPGENNNGIGIAVSPDNIMPEQYFKIVGVAWSESLSGQQGFINVAVGVNANLLARLGMVQEQKIKDQESEIDNLKSQLEKMNDVLSKTIPEYSAMMKRGGDEPKTVAAAEQETAPAQGQRTVIYHNITGEQIVSGLSMAENILRQKGVDVDNNPFFKKIKNDAGYRDSFINESLATIRREMDKNYNADIKSGATVIKF